MIRSWQDLNKIRARSIKRDLDEIWSRSRQGLKRRLHLMTYRNVVANAKKVADMKEVHDSFSKKLCETCLKAKQQSESTRHLMSKTTEFLNEIHVNIEDSLFLTFRDHRFFLLIKNDVFDMFFVYVLKTKEKIFATLKKFRIWIETQSQKKIKRIRSNDELRSHQFDVWFKKTNIQLKVIDFIYFSTKWSHRKEHVHDCKINSCNS